MNKDNEEDGQWQQSILAGIQFKVEKGHPIYPGTVSDKEKNKRRAAKKVAKASRKKNRG